MRLGPKMYIILSVLHAPRQRVLVICLVMKLPRQICADRGLRTRMTEYTLIPREPDNLKTNNLTQKFWL